jgi:hypothetical protein
MAVLDDGQFSMLRHFAARIVPESGGLDEGGLAAFRGIVEQALGARPESVRRQFGVLLKVLQWAPLARYGAPFERLGPERQDKVLRWFEGAPVLVLRKGFWGLKALIFMGFYGRAEAGAQIGYAPSFDGNAELAQGAAK